MLFQSRKTCTVQTADSSFSLELLKTTLTSSYQNSFTMHQRQLNAYSFSYDDDKDDDDDLVFPVQDI